MACGETDFRFDPAALRATASARWPQARVTAPFDDNADLVDCDISVETADGRPLAEIAVHRAGDAIGLDAVTEEEAAEVLAWLATAPGLPDDGSVVVMHWQDGLYPLRPGISTEGLLSDRRS